MLSDDLKQTIQSTYSQLLERKQMQKRGGQKRMIAEIARTLATVDMNDDGRRSAPEPGICVVEAGTGTGKTLAYLVASLPVAKALEKKLVIATATVALQEQVLHKDIPDLLRNSDLKFSYALAKGKGRYLCLAKLDNALKSNASIDAMRDLFRVEVQDPATLDRALYEDMLDALGRGDWHGDRDDWQGALTDEAWRTVAVEQGQCSGSKCSYFSSCCYFRNRENLMKADCIVANHDLVLSDLALGGGVILPHPGESIYVFDEAHQLPGKGIEHFSNALRLGSTGKWLDQFGAVMQRIAQGQQPGKLQALLLEAVALCHTLRGEQLDVFAVLKQFREKAEATNGRGDVSQFVFLRGLIDAELGDMLRALAHEFNELAGRLGKIADVLKECMEVDSEELDRQQAETWYPLFGSAHMRAQSAVACCHYFAQPDEQGRAPHARWLTFFENSLARDGDMDIMLSVSPVIAAAALEERLWDECFAAVLTSATLTALDSFDFLQKKCGLPESASYHRIASPFTYHEAAKLRVPRKGFDPSNNAAHTQAISELLPKLLTEKAGALVLFSSRRQMLDVLGLLPTAFRSLVLCQDDFTKQELLRIHRETVDRKQTSVIFGLASLAEGIDLPGNYCRHVVIAKIPFPVPTDPVDATLGEWVKEQGRNPFQEISIPEAALRLIQASGRLLRQESDTGTITILDERLVTKFYGKAILDSLPPYEREFF
ncbi:MAG TPA: ATP-dependent DNA helicase DinG [Pseudomonadales bacterium]